MDAAVPVGAAVHPGEPGAPPPLTRPEEPQSAPPPSLAEAGSFETEAGSFEAEAASWFEQKFTLSLFGKRLSSETARMLLLGSGATIIVLLVVISTMASKGPEPVDATVGSGGQVTAPAPAPAPSIDPSVRPPPSLILGCTEPNAQNFDPTATANDGSCRYPPPPPSTTSPARAPPPPCVDDPNCVDLISLVGCTHDLHDSEPQIPRGVVRTLLAVHNPQAQLSF